MCVGAFVVGVAGGFLIVYLRSKSAATGETDEVPLGNIQQNRQRGDDDLNKPGPSGWTGDNKDDFAVD